MSVSVSVRPQVLNPAAGATHASYTHVAVRKTMTACGCFLSVLEAPTEGNLRWAAELWLMFAVMHTES